MQGFALFLYILLNTNPSAPSFLGRYILASLLVSRLVSVSPSLTIQADQLFHCPIRDTCTAVYQTYTPGIDEANKISTIRF